jgi:UDPglucose 6-dehydrogenase
VQLTVIGAGYVGLVAAAGFAKLGHRVLVIESDEERLGLLRSGGCPIYEPGLEALLASEAGRLSFGNDLAAALRGSEACFVCVGTPQAADGSADLSATKAALEAVARAMSGYLAIVLKSTVPPGTHALAKQLVAGLTLYDFDIVSNPEFLREGSAVNDFLRPERVVLGLASRRAEGVMRELYMPVVAEAEATLVVMDNASAEVTKYAANAMLATRISFMNEIANLCESLGADVSRVREGIQLDRRIGSLFLDAGVGYGGCCFPKDVRALIHTAAQVGNPLAILSAVDTVNRAQRLRLVEKVAAHFAQELSGKRLALWGLSFKPHTDDVRDAPALSIAEALLARGARIAAYDPKANRRALAALGSGLSLCSDPFAAVAGADALIVATEWPEFIGADLLRLRSELRHPVVFDGRNIWNPARMTKLGFVYHSIGRQSDRPPAHHNRHEASLQAEGGV